MSGQEWLLDETRPVTLARAEGARGEVVLRRRPGRDGSVYELIVNGTFAMDSAEVSSERELAHLALGSAGPGARVLVGGLGLGYTAAEALRYPVGRIDVVELEPALVQWAAEGLTPVLARLAAEPRVNLVVGDIGTAITDAGRTWDAIILDVDNGPDFLIHGENAGLYGRELLSSAFARLAPGARLSIWCQGPSPLLIRTLSLIAHTAREHRYPVVRGERHFCYAVYTLDRPADTAA